MAGKFQGNIRAFWAKDAQEIAAKAVDFDGLLVESANTAEEWAKYAELYNPIPFKEFVGHFKNIDFDSFIKGLVSTEPEKIVVFENRFMTLLTISSTKKTGL